MLIRHADSGRDAAACAAIYAPYVTDGVASLEEDPPDANEMRRRIEAITPRFPWLVAEDTGQVIGYAYAAQHHPRSAYRWAADSTVYIDDARRGRGVGKALYQALLGLLAEQKLRMVCAGITLPNRASVALHESFGFQPVGIYRRIAFKRERWWDVGWWQLDLGAPEGEPPPAPVAGQ